MPPEAILGQDYLSNKVDIWELGVILYNLVTGEMPFSGKNPKVVAQKSLKKKPKFNQKAWKQCSPNAKLLCKQMLTKDAN